MASIDSVGELVSSLLVCILWGWAISTSCPVSLLIEDIRYLSALFILSYDISCLHVCSCFPSLRIASSPLLLYALSMYWYLIVSAFHWLLVCLCHCKLYSVLLVLVVDCIVCLSFLRFLKFLNFLFLSAIYWLYLFLMWCLFPPVSYFHLDLVFWYWHYAVVFFLCHSCDLFLYIIVVWIIAWFRSCIALLFYFCNCL